MSQNFYLGLGFNFMTKNGKLLCCFFYYFSRFYQTKTRPYIKNLRHSSLDGNVGYTYQKFQLSICHSKRDINVQKIKVENAFFVFSALSHVFTFIYFCSIYTTVCV